MKRINGLIDEHLHDWLVADSDKEKRSLVKTITLALEKYKLSKSSKPKQHSKTTNKK